MEGYPPIDSKHHNCSYHSTGNRLLHERHLTTKACYPNGWQALHIIPTNH